MRSHWDDWHDGADFADGLSALSFEDDEWIESDDLASGLDAVLGVPVEAALTPEEVDAWLAETMEQLTPAEGWNLGKALKTVGSALPAVGTVVGTAYGGPVGGAIGSQIGRLGGQQLARVGGPKPKPAKATASPHAGKAMSTNGSKAAAQLIGAMQNPTLLASLLSAALGGPSRKSVPVGKDGAQVTPGAMLNLLAQLAGRAAEEVEANYGPFDSSESLEDGRSYLLDGDGSPLVDAHSPGERADVLLNLLDETFP